MSIHKKNWCRVCRRCFSCSGSEEYFREGNCKCTVHNFEKISTLVTKVMRRSPFRFISLTNSDCEILEGIRQELRMISDPVPMDLKGANICDECHEKFDLAKQRRANFNQNSSTKYFSALEGLVSLSTEHLNRNISHGFGGQPLPSCSSQFALPKMGAFAVQPSAKAGSGSRSQQEVLGRAGASQDAGSSTSTDSDLPLHKLQSKPLKARSIKLIMRDAAGNPLFERNVLMHYSIAMVLSATHFHIPGDFEFLVDNDILVSRHSRIYEYVVLGTAIVNVYARKAPSNHNRAYEG